MNDYLFQSVLRHWPKMLVAMVVLLLLMVCLVCFSPSIYEGSTAIVIDKAPPQSASVGPQTDAEDSQGEIETVVEKLKCPETGIETICSKQFLKKVKALQPKWLKSCTWLVHALPFRRLSNQESLSNGDVSGRHLTEEESEAYQYYLKHVKIISARNSRVAVISFKCPDAEFAALVANRVPEVYLEREQGAAEKVRREYINAIQPDLADCRLRVAKLGEKALSYAKSHGIEALEDARMQSSAEDSALARSYSDARLERIKLEAAVATGAAPRSGGAAAVSDPLNQLIDNKKAELSELLSERIGLYGESHPERMVLEQKLKSYDDLKEKHIDEIIHERSEELKVLNAREAGIAKELDRQAKRLNELWEFGKLRRDALVEEELCNGLYARTVTASVLYAATPSNVRILSKALVPISPVWPDPVIVIPCIGLCTLIGGLGIGIAWGKLDRTIRVPGDLCALLPAARAVTLPHINDGRPKCRLSRRSLVKRETDATPKLWVNQAYICDRGKGQYESMLSLTTLLQLARREKHCLTIAVVSPSRREGKTTVARSLALVLAECGRTCLVHGDLRKRNTDSALGLVDFCNGDLKIQDILQEAGNNLNLNYIFPGSPNGNPVQMLLSPKFTEFMQELKRVFDFVVIDTPPLLEFGDARIYARASDGAVIVGRVGHTSRQALAASAAVLESVGTTVLAGVVNGSRVGRSQNIGAY